MALALTHLPLTGLSEVEADVVNALSAQLDGFTAANRLKTAYYEGTKRLADLGISIPPEMRHVDTVIGWPGTAVDVLEERLDFLGWASSTRDDYGLGAIFTANNLGPESSMGHLDSLIYGVAFVATGAGDVTAGEPEVLVTVESPLSMTVAWSRRSRSVTAALAINEVDPTTATATSITIYLPDETIRADRPGGVGSWKVSHRDRHDLGVVTVSRLVNRPWGAHRSGRSEISRAVRALTDNAVRTLLGSEVAREFYSAPQRWVMGADESSFVDAAGNPVPAWQTYLGRVLAMSRDENGEVPEVGQFPASPPTPYWEAIRGLSQLFAAEAAMPVSYLGLISDNPASADAIKAGEVRLIKRSERRHVQLGTGWKATAAHALMVRDGISRPPDGFADRISCAWRDPSTPTEAASADAATKLVASGILPPDSPVTWDRVGLTQAQQKRLEADNARRRIETFAAEVAAEQP